MKDQINELPLKGGTDSSSVRLSTNKADIPTIEESTHPTANPIAIQQSATQLPAVSSTDAPALHKTAIIYLRVSTDRQAHKGGHDEGYSLPVQRNVCTRKAHDLQAEVVEEFIDAGSSAKSADRPALQDMLVYLEKNHVDYVIVHKVDRLARNRADDVTIDLAIHKAGGALVSATEAIDATPAGTLLHGIMSSIAEFYSKNLSEEAKKGLHEKARRGETPSYAPLGYINSTKRLEGHEIKTIELDPDRADLITWAFEAYATNEWSISELTDELAHRGLKSRTTRKLAGKPLGRSGVHRLLSNPYYMGILHYGGVEYQGNHPAIIDEATFQAVQAILGKRRLAGDRAWKHQQYLKGSIFCGRCKERLGFATSQGRGGDYPYFFCLGRHQRRNNCDLPYLLTETVEQTIVDFWQTITFTPELVTQVRAAVDEELTKLTNTDQRELTKQTQRIKQLERQKQKLLAAYMADAISIDDLKIEQDRIKAELANANKLLKEASSHYQGIRYRLNLTLKLLQHAGDLYRQFQDTGRQTLNQILFKALFLDVDSNGTITVATAELNPEFAALVVIAQSITAQSSSTDPRPTASLKHLLPRAIRCQSQTNKKPQLVTSSRGANLLHLAEGVGFEPTVTRSHNGFRDRPIRPLSHPSEFKASGNQGGWKKGSLITQTGLVSPKPAEKFAQNSRTPLRLHPRSDLDLMVESRVCAHVINGATRPRFGIRSSEDKPFHPGSDESPCAHHARLQGG